MAKTKLRTCMIFWIWGTTLIIFVTLLSTNFYATKKRIEKEIEENAVNLARYYGKRLDLIFTQAAMIPEMESAHFESGNIYESDAVIKRYLKRVVELNPIIYGSCIAFEPYGAGPKRESFAPYYYYNHNRLDFNDLSKTDYKYQQWDWYQKPKTLQKPIWTEPYFDKGGGNVLMVTYAYPFYQQGRFAGVATVDVSLENIVQDIEKLKILDTGYGFMLSQEGVFLSFPDKNKVGKENITTVVPSLAEEMKTLASLPSGQWVFTKDLDPLRHENSWLILRPVRHEGAIVGAVVFVYPIKEVMQDIIDLQDVTQEIGLIGLLILFIVILIIASSISRPIVSLAAGVDKVAHGDLNYKIKVKSKNKEVLTLQDGFNKMIEDLKIFIKNLQESTAAKERIESELKIASEIQHSMLPRIFPPFPQRHDFNIYAIMDPAKEVGGDFYDFFLIGENKLCFLVGDVSGKGVPAALFMMINKVLLKNEGLSGSSPERILSRVNNIISEDNEELMFVTIFCAILDLTTGEVQFSNAGHNPPLIGSPARGFEYIKADKNFVLGVKPNFNFTLNKTTLRPGDTFFLYTDGVTEALNREAKLFTEARLEESLNRVKGLEVTGMIGGVKKDIKEFAQGTEQSDDITMLAVKFNGKEV